MADVPIRFPTHPPKHYPYFESLTSISLILLNERKSCNLKQAGAGCSSPTDWDSLLVLDWQESRPSSTSLACCADPLLSNLHVPAVKSFAQDQRYWWSLTRRQSEGSHQDQGLHTLRVELYSRWPTLRIQKWNASNCWARQALRRSVEKLGNVLCGLLMESKRGALD